MATAAVPEVLAVPRGSIVVFRAADFGPDQTDTVHASISGAIGHEEFAVVFLPDGADVAVVHDPPAMAELLGLIDRSNCGHYHCEHG